MLQWNVRLFAVLVLVVMVAAMLGSFEVLGGEVQFGW
jgi:hypothetical protein